jgi:hypothetical protein
MIFAGVILIVFGVVYLKRPDIFRRGIWMKTSIAIRTLSEVEHLRYMRRLGLVFILLGATLIVWDLARSFL